MDYYFTASVARKSYDEASIFWQNDFYCATKICIARTSYGNVAGWVAGWLSVCHSRYCIKTTKLS